MTIKHFDGELYYRRKRKAVRFMGGKCAKCGDRDPDVLHFHHHGRKRFNLSAVFGDDRVLWPTILEELAQTTLLCANDHIRLHAKERRDAWEKRKAAESQD